ncbi:MAG: murein biosynthesis integral membrane protein MurJ [Pseudomonadota bacterium]
MTDTVIPDTTTERERFTRAAGVVAFFTFLSRILGLIRDMVVAGFFGSGMAADAFFVAFRIPNLLRRLFAEGSLTIAFIPIFTEYLHQKGRENAFQMARVVLTALSILLAVVTLLGILFSPWIVRIQAFGFGGEGSKYDLTVLLTRITFPYIFLISIVAFCMGVLNSLRHFAAPAAAPIFLNIGIILSTLILSPHLSQPIVAVAIGVIFGGILQVGLQIPWLVKRGLSLRPCWMPEHPAIRRIGMLMLPALFGSAIYQFNQFIGTLLASFLPEGSISWLYYADRLVQFPLGVFAIAISTAALPSLSKQVAEKDLSEFKGTLEHALRLVFFITIPAVFGLVILGKVIVRLFFERGVFDAFSTVNTYKALIFYSFGLSAFSGIRVVVSAFYSLQDTVTPVKIAAVALALNVGFSLLLIGPMAHGGLALALTLASTAQFLLLVFFLKKRIDGWDLRPILISVGKYLFSATIMGLVIHYLYAKWDTPSPCSGTLDLTLNIAGLLFIGAFVYFMVTRVLGCRELTSFLSVFRPLLKRKKSFEKHLD